MGWFKRLGDRLFPYTLGEDGAVRNAYQFIRQSLDQKSRESTRIQTFDDAINAWGITPDERRLVIRNMGVEAVLFLGLALGCISLIVWAFLSGAGWPFYVGGVIGLGTGFSVGMVRWWMVSVLKQKQYKGFSEWIFHGF